MFVIKTFSTSFVITLLGKLYVITEFCSGGNLRQFLINSRVNYTQEKVLKYINVMSSLNCHQLLKIALDIVKGMIHLASKKVHCCLLTHVILNY